MVNEPNNVEEQLKQYAAERRQQVPPEIHPATRNMLHGEVRRTYGNPAAERRARLRLRWMQAFAAIAIAAAIPLFLLPRNPKENVQESLPPQPGQVTLPTEKKRGEAPIVLSDTKEPVPRVLAEEPAPSGSQPAPAPMARDEARAASATRARQLQSERPAAPMKAQATADLAAASIGNNVRLSFANSVSNQEVLNRFQLEQTGERLKFVETDGSVYSGRVFSQQAGNDAFQAAGVNRTLNKTVILTGQVVRASLNTSEQAQSQVNTLQNNRAINSSAGNASNYAEDVRVQGQATVGNQQYKVDAQVTPGP